MDDRDGVELVSDGLIGRREELGRIRAFLDVVVKDSGARLVWGEPGVGKSVLLAAAAQAADAAGMNVLRASGVEFEADVSYSGLNHALHPVNAALNALSPVHRDALTVALGLGTGAPPDRLVVCNATLALLRVVANDRPLLLVVDDLHWLDRASAMVLGFVARRIAGTHIGLVAGARSGVETFFERGGVTDYEIRPLDEAAAADLLDSRFPGLALHVRRRLLAEAQGNPLALLELPMALSNSQRGSAQPLPAVLPLSSRLQTVFASRVSQLPSATRQLLLLAVFEGTGDLRLLRAAAGPSGLKDLASAERAQLVYVDDSTARIAFRHPLIRSAIVELSTHDQRRQAHQALADLLVDEAERRAWHLAEATIDPDEHVAGLLETVAHRILQRGDAVGAVTALIRAADLSPAKSDRGRRFAEAAYIGAEGAGDLRTASALLANARQADPRMIRSLHAAAAAAYLLINADGDVPTAHRLLVGAIDTGSHNYDASDDGLIEALHNLLLVCWWGGRAELWDPFYAALARLKPRPPEVLSLLSRTFPDPARTAASALEDFDALVGDLNNVDDARTVTRLVTASVYVDRIAQVRESAWRLVKQGREGGPARRQLSSLNILCLEDFLIGHWDEGERLADEGLAVCEAHGYRFFEWYFLFNKAMISAGRGDFDTSNELADRILQWAVPRGVHSAELFAHQPRVLAAIGRGDFEDAYQHATALSPAGTLAPYVPRALWVIFDLVEAAVRTGRQPQAVAHVRAMHEADIAAISPRMALLQGGSTALATTDESAVELFEQALSVPGAERWPFDRARVQLAFGERLRRARATTESRVQLIAAFEAFQRMGAVPLANRANNELRASGMTKRRTNGVGALALTPQEREIALLAASGLTNKEIAERLFLAPKTVSAHLYRIFPKLGITSRAALRDALGSSQLDEP